MPERRGFLRALTALPLIGGAVTLIGAPSAVAEPCTDATLLRYCAWLAHEHRAALVERARIAEGRDGPITELVRHAPPMTWFPECPPVEAVLAAAPPSARAALVLSTVGCAWRPA